MRNKMKYLLLPLFCLSISLSGCNSNSDKVKKIIETEYTWNNVENIHVREINTETYTFYEVYVYTKFKNSKGGYTYGIDMYVYDNGNLEWIYSK